jgi:hypothetical protein
MEFASGVPIARGELVRSAWLSAFSRSGSTAHAMILCFSCATEVKGSLRLLCCSADFYRCPIRPRRWWPDPD